MRRKRYIRKKRGTAWTPESSKLANKARWDAEKERRDSDHEWHRHVESLEIENLPRKQGDPVGCIQFTDYRTGKVRKWVLRIGNRIDRFTVHVPNEKPTDSHGLTWIMAKLRSKLANVT